MASVAKITGAKTIIRNLEKVNKRYAKGTETGLKLAGHFLEKESRAIVPVQLGNLKASSFTRNIGGSGFRADVIVGYTAHYAVYVHENLEAAHGKEFNAKHAAEISGAVGTKRERAKRGLFNRGENQQAKFLEKPAREKRGEILRIIKMGAKI